jgi:nucleotide-binding universal stress UspA family protein
MVRLTSILCPVDLSDCSRNAFDHALALARSYHARLTVVEVSWPLIPPIAYPAAAGVFPVPMTVAGDIEELREGLRGFAARGTEAGVEMDLQVREGVVVPTILGEAHRIGADLIVLGTHGRSGFDRLMLGSVTEKILRKAECAVMTVPPADRTERPARTRRTIVCAVDFSRLANRAVDYALSLAQELQARLLLIHAIEWPPERLMSGSEEREIDALRVAARRTLHALVPDEARAWCETEEVIALGRAHEEIVRIARERDADLIVLGVHGRSALNVALFGSTANQVVRHATCPVVTVRS